MYELDIFFLPGLGLGLITSINAGGPGACKFHAYIL